MKRVRSQLHYMLPSDHIEENLKEDKRQLELELWKARYKQAIDGLKTTLLATEVGDQVVIKLGALEFKLQLAEKPTKSQIGVDQ